MHAFSADKTSLKLFVNILNNDVINSGDNELIKQNLPNEKNADYKSTDNYISNYLRFNVEKNNKNNTQSYILVGVLSNNDTVVNFISTYYKYVDRFKANSFTKQIFLLLKDQQVVLEFPENLNLIVKIISIYGEGELSYQDEDDINDNHFLHGSNDQISFMHKNRNILVKSIFGQEFGFYLTYDLRPEENYDSILYGSSTLFNLERDINERIDFPLIYYCKLKPYLTQKYSISNVINDQKIKRYLDKYKGIERNIIQVKFKSGEKLIKSLINDNKKYYLISRPLWNKICKYENIDDKGIPFSFEKNYIILYLNKNEKLYFKINDGIIEKSNFIENKSIYRKSERIKENNEEDDNAVNENLVLSNRNFKFKKEIEILIRLYYYHKKLKETKNASSFLFDDNKEIVYLINKLWMEKFKIFFAYKEIELILEQINISESLYKDKNLICDYFIEDIISYFPLN
jgi:hypothetical protein